MRKFFIGLMALALLGVFVAPDFASAAEVKMMGIFRYRGVTAEDTDLNDEKHDGRQSGDQLVRVRWTAKSEGGKVWAIYELDFQSGGITHGNTTSRIPVGLNRWLVDFAIPGTSLRARWGKTDWTLPGSGRDIVGGSGRNRIQGYGVYGKLMGPVSFQLFTTKTDEGVNAADDADTYYLVMKYKAAPNITINPFVIWDHNNGASNGGNTITNDSTADNIWWYGVNMKAKFGIASLDVTGIIEDGEFDFSRGVNASGAPGTQDVDVEAWAALIRLWLSFGKLKVGFYGSFFSGDEDAVNSGTGGNFVKGQSGNKLERFTSPRRNSTARIDGPQIITGRRYSTFRVGCACENRAGSGDGGAGSNGAQFYELLFKYKLSKALELAGNLSFVRSAEQRSNIDANLNGVSTDAGDTTYDSSKDVGTEVDISAKYSIYKSLWTRVTFAYLFAGDYGKIKTVNGVAPAISVDNDDAWALYTEIRHTFKQ